MRDRFTVGEGALRGWRGRGASLPLGLGVALALALVAPVRAHDPEPLPVDCSVLPPGQVPLLFPYGVRSANCGLAVPGEQDVFAFLGGPDEVVRIVFHTVAAIDPEIVVRDPEAVVVFETSCDGGTAPTQDPCILELDLDPLIASGAGSWEIAVSDAGGDETGDYTIQLERIPPPCDAAPVCDTAEYVGLGEDFLDFQTLAAPTDTDFLLFEAAAAERVRVDLWTSVVPNLQPRLEIWDPDLSLLAEADCPEAAPNGLVCASVEVDVGGEGCSELDPCVYTLGISEAGHDDASPITGGYFVSVVRLPEPGSAASGTVAAAVLLAVARVRHAARSASSVS